MSILLIIRALWIIGNRWLRWAIVIVASWPALIAFAALELPPALLNTSSLPPPAPAPPVLHWVYVKRAWRRMGVATRLLGQLSPSACCHSHWTSAIHPWAHVKWSGLRYDPYLQVTPQS